MNWIALEKMEQLEAINKASFEQTQIIYKHSTTCNISADAYEEMRNVALSAWYLDLLTFRAISNQIAELYNVKHQSPQVIFVKDGKAIYSESHWRIKAEEIKTQFEQL